METAVTFATSDVGKLRATEKEIPQPIDSSFS